MCKIFEDMQKEAVMEIAKRMIADGTFPLEKVAEYTELSLEEVQDLQARQEA